MILTFEQDLVVFWILDYGNWSGKNGKELGFLRFLQVVFKHENHGSPPSLSYAGKMRSGQKYELVQLLEASTTVECPDVDVNVFDAAAVVNMLPPGKSRTFKDYATSVFLNYVIKQAQNIKRIDFIRDLYFENSLRRSRREERGSGVRRRVCDNAFIPVNWKSFLRSDDNKKRAFSLFSRQRHCNPASRGGGNHYILCGRGQPLSSRDGRPCRLQPRGGGYEDLHSCEARINQGS